MTNVITSSFGAFVCVDSELAKAFNKKNAKGERIEKSIAFPTCLSINKCVLVLFSDCVAACAYLAAVRA